MSTLKPLRREDCPELEGEFQFCEQFLGFVPNDLLTMAHVPELMRNFMVFCRSTYEVGKLDMGLLQLVGTMTSWGSGCQYCTAHMAQTSPRFGVSTEKVEALWEFETSELFSDAERAALRVALKAGQSPNQTESDDIDALSTYYDTEQIVQLMSVICLFGFLNRWNDTLATELEEAPRLYAEQHISAKGWHVGKHGDNS